MLKTPDFFDKSKPANYDGLFNWDRLSKDVFPMFSSEDFMDIDAVMEKNGRFLGFETKSIHSKLPMGQQITINALLDTGYFTFIFLLFETDETYEKNWDKIAGIGVIYPNDEKRRTISVKNKTHEERYQVLVNLVKEWREDAENLGKLSKREIKPIIEEKIVEIKCECWYCKLRRMILNYIKL